MSVKRIVANLSVDNASETGLFYQSIFGLELLMDLGWIRTYGSSTTMPVQVSVAEQGGSETAVPDLSIEVDNFDEVLQRVEAHNITIEYGPITEPWGVTRFFIRDPCGNLMNVLKHT